MKPERFPDMPMLKIIYLTAVLALTLTQLTADAMAQPGLDIIKEGRQLARKNCTRCHAIDMTGKSPHKDAPPFREVVKRYSVWSLAEAFAEGITTGHPDMPEFKFNPKEITALLSFMESLEDKPRQPTPGKEQSE